MISQNQFHHPSSRVVHSHFGYTPNNIIYHNNSLGLPHHGTTQHYTNYVSKTHGDLRSQLSATQPIYVFSKQNRDSEQNTSHIRSPVSNAMIVQNTQNVVQNDRLKKPNINGKTSTISKDDEVFIKNVSQVKGRVLSMKNGRAHLLVEVPIENLCKREKTDKQENKNIPTIQKIPTSTIHHPGIIYTPKAPNRQINLHFKTTTNLLRKSQNTPNVNISQKHGSGGLSNKYPAKRVILDDSNKELYGGIIRVIDAHEISNFHPSKYIHEIFKNLINSTNTFNYHISRMTGVSGGLNEGIWLVDISCPEKKKSSFVLKIIKSKRSFDFLPTEFENYLHLFSKGASLFRQDASVIFPRKMFDLAFGNHKSHHLIVMNKAKGLRLSEYIPKVLYKNPTLLKHVMTRVGEALARFVCIPRFHKRYLHTQHTDFQPSNIMYDDKRDFVTFIDTGGMGALVLENDMEHFLKSVQILEEVYGHNFASISGDAFIHGYTSITS